MCVVYLYPAGSLLDEEYGLMYIVDLILYLVFQETYGD